MVDYQNEKSFTRNSDIPAFRPKSITTYTDKNQKNTENNIPLAMINETSPNDKTTHTIANDVTTKDLQPNLNSGRSQQKNIQIDDYPEEKLSEDEGEAEIPSNFAQKSAFRLSQFIQILIIHLFYYMVTGPVTILIILILYGMTAASNMGFTSGMDALYQNLLWVCNFTVFIIFIYNGGEELQDLTIRLIIISFMRALIISFRYAYMPRQLFNDFKSKDLTKNNENYKDQIIKGLLDFTPNDIEDELILSLSRQSVDPQSFLISFRDKIPQILYDKLTIDGYYMQFPYDSEKEENLKQNFIIQKEHTETSVIHPSESNTTIELEKVINKHEKTRQNFNGLKLVREIILYGNLGISLPKLLIIPTGLHGVILIITMIVYTEIYEISWQVLISKIIYIIVSGYLEIMHVIMILSFAVIFKQKAGYLSILNHIISGIKNMNYYFPRANLYLPGNLWNIVILKRTIMDYGIKFTKRVICYLHIFLLYYLINMIVVLLYCCKINIWDYSRDFILFCIFDLLILLTLPLCFSLYYAIGVNNATEKYLELLQKCRKNIYWMKMAIQYQDTFYELPYGNNKELTKMVESNSQSQSLNLLADLLQIVNFGEAEIFSETNLHYVKICGFMPNLFEICLIFGLGIGLSISSILKFANVY